MGKIISVTNLNAFVANNEIDCAIAASGSEVKEKSVRLVKMVLRKSPTHKLQKNVPLVAFVKNAGDKVVAKVLTNGVVVVLNNSNISSLCEVKGDFSLNGVIYGVKDTINGFPRYKVKKTKI